MCIFWENIIFYSIFCFLLTIRCHIVKKYLKSNKKIERKILILCFRSVWFMGFTYQYHPLPSIVHFRFPFSAKVSPSFSTNLVNLAFGLLSLNKSRNVSNKNKPKKKTNSTTQIIKGLKNVAVLVAIIFGS